jgi:hypothetical protein
MRIRAILAALFVTARWCAAAPILTIYDLGTLGGANATATGINGSGQVSGWGTDAAGNVVAITPAGLIAGAYGAAINAAGQVAGYTIAGGHASAVVWSNGSARAVAGVDSYAMAINDRGQTAGMATNAQGLGIAFVSSGAC